MPKRSQALNDIEVIASREYVVEGSDPPKSVTIRIGSPKQRASDGRYECGAEVNEAGQIWVRYMTGDDAIESLQLALIIIGTDLKHISERIGRLSWLNGKRADLAVPTYPDFSLRPIMAPPEGEKS